MIRGRKPQAYNTSTKSTDSLLIPAVSVDFADQKDLETKVTEINESISNLDEKQKTLEDTVNSSLDIPKQLGTVVYNGELQAPVWDIRSSRIMISGETVGKDARTYTAKATILNGEWKTDSEEPLAAEQPITWTISKKKIPKPSINGIYVEDGTLQEVKLCDFNPLYCSVTGSTKARSAGEYGINVKINNTNVTWDDGDDSDSFPLSWRMISKSADITGAETSITALTSEVGKLKTAVSNLQELVNSNSTAIENMLEGHGGATCSCAPIISSLRRRIELLETFASLNDDTFNMSALIELLTQQVVALELSASDMSQEVLEEEVNSIVSAINKALARATDSADIETLNNLKTRVLNVYSINAAGEQLKDFRATTKEKKTEIKNLINDGDTEGAERELDKLKQDFKDLKDSMDDDTKAKVKSLLDDIDNTIKDLEKEIIRKKVQKVLSDVEKKLNDIENKISEDEDPTTLIEETEDLLDDADDLVGDNNLPFEQDRILTDRDKLDSLKELQETKGKIAELTITLKDIKDNMSTYTNAQITEKIAGAVTTLREIKETAAHFDPTVFNSDITTLENSLEEVQDLFWKKQQEKTLADITTRLNEIKAEVLAADPETDDMTQWNVELGELEVQVGDIRSAATVKEIIPDNLSSTEELLTSVRNVIAGSNVARSIAAIDSELDTLQENINEGLITYTVAVTQLDDINARITALESDDNTEDIKSSLILLRAKYISTRQLNEDMKVYLDIKPVLRSIKARIYDEDLDILWSEFNAVKGDIPTMGTSSWIRELQNDATEIENILNSFSKDNTVDNVLSHLDTAMQIIVTVSEFEPTGTTYDEIKLDLQNLEKASITMTEDELISFPTWYSLSDADKAYLLENSLRKIRRNVITTEAVSA